MSIIGAILAIGLLIIVHEAGHYFVARWCKMRVDRFSVGFGPPILSWKHGETDFTLGPVPFGGFVQINGMTMSDDFDDDDYAALCRQMVESAQGVVSALDRGALGYIRKNVGMITQSCDACHEQYR